MSAIGLSAHRDPYYMTDIPRRSSGGIFNLSCALLFLFSVLFVPSLWSQSSSTGALTGILRDSSGAVVPNATITLTSLNTSYRRTTATGMGGAYKCDLLIPGIYSVKFEAVGFKTVETSSVEIQATETRVLNGSLETIPELESNSMTGLRLFEQHCAICHVNARGGQRAPDRSALKKLPPEEILNALTIGSMSGQARGLSDVEKRSIAESLSSQAFGTGMASDATSMSNHCASNPRLADPFAGPIWNGWGVDPANTRFQKAKDAGISADQLRRLKLKWAFGFPNGIAFSQPTIASGRVFVGSNNGYVYSLDAATGCVYWSFRAGPGVHTAISIGSPRGNGPAKFAIYFGDMKANVYAVDAENGRLLWKTRIDDHPLAHITGAPKLYSNSLYVPVSSSEEGRASDMHYPCCTFRGSVVRLEATTGRQVWKTYTISEPLAPTKRNSLGTQLWGPAGVAVWDSPTIDAKRHALYVGTGDSYTEPAAGNSDSVMALDMNSGRILWSAQDTDGDVWIRGCDAGGSENCPKNLGPDYDFGSSPILRTLPNGHQIIVAAQKSGNVLAHDPDHQGALLWKTNLADTPPSAEGLIVFGGAADERSAYFPLTIGGVAAVQLSTGQRQWLTRFELPGPDSSGSPRSYGQTAAGSTIPGIFFTGGWDGILRALSTTTGAVIWKYNTVRRFDSVNGVPGTGGSMGAAGPTIAGGMLFVGSGYLANPGPGEAYPGNVLLAFGLD
jgi:polyvinyl alcohol dehydrogenase (cytochrome)